MCALLPALFFPPFFWGGSLFLICYPPLQPSRFLPSLRGGGCRAGWADHFCRLTSGSCSIPSASPAAGAPHGRVQVWSRFFRIRPRGTAARLCLPVFPASRLKLGPRRRLLTVRLFHERFSGLQVLLLPAGCRSSVLRGPRWEAERVEETLGRAAAVQRQNPLGLLLLLLRPGSTSDLHRSISRVQTGSHVARPEPGSQHGGVLRPGSVQSAPESPRHGGHAPQSFSGRSRGTRRGEAQRSSQQPQDDLRDGGEPRQQGKSTAVCDSRRRSPRRPEREETKTSRVSL